jgi:hypothetical protein
MPESAVENIEVQITAGLKLQFIRTICRDETLSAAEKLVGIVLIDYCNDEPAINSTDAPGPVMERLQRSATVLLAQPKRR